MNKACAAITVWEKEQIDISGDIGELNALGIECRSVPLHHSQDAERIVAALSDADYVISGSERYDAQTIPRLPKLKLIVRFGVGYDSVDLAVVERCGVAVCNLPGANAAAVAEHTLGMMLAVTHRLQQHTERIKRGQYAGVMADSITGTVGLVGFGAIARNLAKYLRVFGVRIMAYDPYVTAEEMAACGVKKAELEEVVRSANILSLHLPNTKETYHLVNREFLARMPQGAYLFNTSRGAVVDEAALAEALSSGHLSGAGLDVFETEPLPDDSPLKAADNIVLTPHAATATFACFHHMIRTSAHEIASFHMGEPFGHLLNPGYAANRR